MITIAFIQKKINIISKMMSSQKICVSTKQSFQSYCPENVLKIFKVPADGHCLIYSFLVAVYGNYNQYDQILTSIKQELVNNINKWIEYTPYCSNHQIYYDSIKEYLNNKVWDSTLCDIMLNCLSKILKTKVKICQVENNHLKMLRIQSYESNYQRTIHIKFESYHYDALVKSKFFYLKD